MLSRQQIKDSRKCDEMQEQDEDMDCLGCSCSVCIAQVQTDLQSGLKKAKEIVEKEMEFAKKVNPQMAMGMSQVLKLIEKEIKNESEDK